MAGRFTLSTPYVSTAWNITVSTWDYSLNMYNGKIRHVDIHWYSSAGAVVGPQVVPGGPVSSVAVPKGTAQGVIAGKMSTVDTHIATLMATAALAGETPIQTLDRAVKTYAIALYPALTF